MERGGSAPEDVVERDGRWEAVSRLGGKRQGAGGFVETRGWLRRCDRVQSGWCCPQSGFVEWSLTLSMTGRDADRYSRLSAKANPNFIQIRDQCMYFHPFILARKVSLTTPSRFLATHHERSLTLHTSSPSHPPSGRSTFTAQETSISVLPRR